MMKKRRIRLSPAFKEANKSDARYRILYGGAGSGKSHYVGQEIILNMIQSDEYRYLAVRKTGRSIRHSVFKLLLDLINEMGLRDLFKVNTTEMSITSITGSSLITSGLDDVEKLKSIANINRIWIEEASEVTETDFNQLDLRLRGQSQIGYQMTLTFNPISETHWLKRVFFDVGRANSYVLKTTYKDNPFLDDDYIRTLEDLEQHDPNYFRIYALGEWGNIGNLIFSNWRKEDLSGYVDTFDNIYHGIDFGFSDDPTAYIAAHYDRKRKKIYIFKERYWYQHFIDEVANDIQGVDYITCDTEPRSIADLRRHGIKAYAAKKGPGSVEHGIKFLQSHELVIDESCTNTIAEIGSYKWRTNKDGEVLPKPVDDNNHLIDALRYALESEMTHNTIKIKTFKGGI